MCNPNPAAAAAVTESQPSSRRLLSIDVYRGWVMVLMLAEVLRFCTVAEALPGNRWWAFLCSQQSHAAWTGCPLHDLIQPGFAFLVGVALPFSLARRIALGQTKRQMIRHAVGRSVALIGLGLLLTAVHPRHVVWSFIDTLILI